MTKDQGKGRGHVDHRTVSLSVYRIWSFDFYRGKCEWGPATVSLCVGLALALDGHHRA